MDLVRIIKRIEDLYNPNDISESDIGLTLSKYPDRVEEWNKSLGKYSDDEIIQAIDEYWRYKSNDTRPKIAHIQAMLKTRKEDEYVPIRKDEDQEKLAYQAELTKEKLRKEMLAKFGG